MAVMAKKWKMRSNTEDDDGRTSSQVMNASCLCCVSPNVYTTYVLHNAYIYNGLCVVWEPAVKRHIYKTVHYFRGKYRNLFLSELLHVKLIITYGL